MLELQEFGTTPSWRCAFWPGKISLGPPIPVSLCRDLHIQYPVLYFSPSSASLFKLVSHFWVNNSPKCLPFYIRGLRINKPAIESTQVHHTVCCSLPDLILPLSPWNWNDTVSNLCRTWSLTLFSLPVSPSTGPRVAQVALGLPCGKAHFLLFLLSSPSTLFRRCQSSWPLPSPFLT